MITSAVILMQMLVGVLLWNRLPETMATHFDFHNEPNGWSSRTFAVFGMPLVLLGLDTGVPQWGVFSLLFPVGQGEFVRFPRYILFLLAGFLTVYGFYGRREV